MNPRPPRSTRTCPLFPYPTLFRSADPPFARRDAVFDRILDDRLQDQDGHAGVFEVVGNVDIDLQPIGKACLLDIEIQALERDLLLQAEDRKSTRLNSSH